MEFLSSCITPHNYFSSFLTSFIYLLLSLVMTRPQRIISQEERIATDHFSLPACRINFFRAIFFLFFFFLFRSPSTFDTVAFVSILRTLYYITLAILWNLFNSSNLSADFREWHIRINFFHFTSNLANCFRFYPSHAYYTSTLASKQFY